MLRRCCLLFHKCGSAAAAPCLSGTAGAEPRCVLPYTQEIFWKTQQQLFLGPRSLRAAAPWWTRPNPQNPAPPNPSCGQMLIRPEWLLTGPRTLTPPHLECYVGVGCCRSYVHALDRVVKCGLQSCSSWGICHLCPFEVGRLYLLGANSDVSCSKTELFGAGVHVCLCLFFVLYS